MYKDDVLSFLHNHVVILVFKMTQRNVLVHKESVYSQSVVYTTHDIMSLS